VSNASPNGDTDEPALARRFLASDGLLFVGALAFAAAAVIVYWIVMSLGVHR